MRAVIAALTSTAWLLALAPAAANDSTAELTTGGLVFARTPDVEMRAEDLFISEKEVRVRYRFFNASPSDVTSLVAFPMPDVVWEGPDVNIAIPSDDPENFLDFHTLADGRAVAAKIEQKVIANGVDQTARLRALGVPLAPQRAPATAALDALPPAKQAELLDLKMATPDDYDVGKGMEHHLAPNWTLKSTYFWRQTFPAGREIVIEHRYRPSVGETVGTQLGSPDIEAQSLEHYEKRLLHRPGLPEFGASRDVEARCVQRRLQPVLRAAHRLHPDDRRQLGRADRRFSSGRRQGRAQFAGQLLRRRREKDQSDAIRTAPRQFHAVARAEHSDPLSAQKLSWAAEPRLLVWRPSPSKRGAARAAAARRREAHDVPGHSHRQDRGGPAGRGSSK